MTGKNVKRMPELTQTQRRLSAALRGAFLR